MTVEHGASVRPLNDRRLSIGLRAAVVVVALAASGVVWGYIRHADRWITLLAGLQGMSVLTAFGILGLCAALLAGSLRRLRAERFFAVIPLLLGCCLLAAHLATGSDALSGNVAQWLFDEDALRASQMSPATAGCLAALGLACWMRARPWFSDTFAILALLTTGMALLGYAYGIQDLYAVHFFRTMALHTALCLFLLSMASLMIRVDQGLAAIILSEGPGGRATRRQLAFLLVPAALGFVLLQAIASNRIGLAAAMALFVVSIIVPLGLLILRDGFSLNELDQERQQRSSDQAAAAAELSIRLEAQAQALQRESAERASLEQSLARTQRMEAVGQLTGGIAHDFNNLLMALGGNVKLLLKRLDSEHPARRFALRAEEAVERGAKLTGQLLTFSRMQKLNVRPIPADPTLAVARELAMAALGPQFKILALLRATNGWALADSDQLELAVLNLVLNARDAMPEGGEVVLESGFIRTRLNSGEDVGDYISIAVRDSGCGMTPAVEGRAIEPFFTTKELGKGSGLGLAQVYGFVRQCGGDLRIETEVGQGTTVRMLLHSVAEPVNQVIRINSPQVSETILPAQLLLVVIDDDEAVRSVLVQALRDSGFTVLEAPDGAAGLALLERHMPAAAIIDFLMPGINGAEVARQARERQPSLPIIFVSGYYDTAALGKIAGAVVLKKPVDMKQLRRAILSVMANPLSNESA